MRDKTTNTKADLLKMLAEAVLNTPGATPVEIRDAQPELKRARRSAPKRTVKIKSGRRKVRRRE
jgi:hypothetical protein